MKFNQHMRFLKLCKVDSGTLPTFLRDCAEWRCCKIGELKLGSLSLSITISTLRFAENRRSCVLRLSSVCEEHAGDANEPLAVKLQEVWCSPSFRDKLDIASRYTATYIKTEIQKHGAHQYSASPRKKCSCWCSPTWKFEKGYRSKMSRMRCRNCQVHKTISKLIVIQWTRRRQCVIQKVPRTEPLEEWILSQYRWRRMWTRFSSDLLLCIADLERESQKQKEQRRFIFRTRFETRVIIRSALACNQFCRYSEVCQCFDDDNEIFSNKENTSEQPELSVTNLTIVTTETQNAWKSVARTPRNKKNRSLKCRKKQVSRQKSRKASSWSRHLQFKKTQEATYQQAEGARHGAGNPTHNQCVRWWTTSALVLVRIQQCCPDSSCFWLLGTINKNPITDTRGR